MAKKILTLHDMENKCESNLVLSIYVLFTLGGLAVVLSMLENLISNYNTSNLVGFIVCSCVFGGVFTYFLGIRNLVYALRNKALVKNGQIWFVIDEVTDKYHSINISDSSEVRDYQIELKKYSAKTNKRIFLRNRAEYNAAHVGDPCILGFTKMSKRPFCVFAGRQYDLDAQLQSKVVADISW